MSGQNQKTPSQSYTDICAMVDTYIRALQNSDSGLLKKIFMPEASYYYFVESKLVGGSIAILYKTVDQVKIHTQIMYNIAAINISGRIASVTLDIENLMGVHIIDMFTLVQDDTGAWKIASKVARRPEE